jgi:hypothetical protein
MPLLSADGLQAMSDKDKETLLQSLVIKENKRRVIRNSAQLRYQKKRREIDAEYRQKCNDIQASCHRRRYNDDPEYRERVRQRARERYHERKSLAAAASESEQKVPQMENINVDDCSPSASSDECISDPGPSIL